MPAPILTTRLYIPQPRFKVVIRPRLVERLDDGLGRKLVLVSAPAGFGKTTLVSTWIDQKARSGRLKAAWLSLDEGDKDFTSFLAYLVAALQTLDKKIGEGVLVALQSSQPLPAEVLLSMLINEIAALPDHFLLVLDDYHRVDSKAVDQALAFLLEHLPAQMCLVITTREDPRLPLARLRARSQLTELRSADLRFTPPEAAEFLNQVMGLELSAEDIAALETRTEGWIAGLQLAAISMQGREDIASFVRAFTGSHRFVLDYLVEEVLQRQSERMRSFLLQTAILDRLCGSLCNAVAGCEDGRSLLEVLERSNLFVVPLDDHRQWYRYHHLFADVLQTHLMEAQPDLAPVLHQRASVWYEQNNLRADAIRHALAARDFARAAGLIELAWSAMDISYQSAAWLGWAKALPGELIRVRPVLSVGYAWALLDGGEMQACEARLQDAERWLDKQKGLEPSSNEMIISDEEQFRSLPASIATARAYRALALGDVASAARYARQALALTPEQDQVRLIQATALLGIAQYASGDLEGADRSLADFQVDLQKSGDIQTSIGIAFTLADIRMARGRLQDVFSTYQQALQLAAGQGDPLPVGTADLYRGIGELYCEWGDLEAASQYVLDGKKLGEQAVTTGWLHRLCVAEARIKDAQGDLDGALALLEDAERLYIRSPLPDVRPIAAQKARVWVRQGRLIEATGWVRKQGLSPGDELSYLREFDHITLVRLLIARHRSDQEGASIQEAVGLLLRLRQAAEEGHRVGSVIEILVLQALAYQVQGNIPAALACLERALVLAEPEGYFRIFVAEGEPMHGLISALRLSIEKRPRSQEYPRIGYIDRILAACAPPAAASQAETSVHSSSTGGQKSALVEPLSERELEVLRLLRTELGGPEIARQLIVSLNTLHTHTKNIYNKLGVNNRRSAVHRAEELDLF